MEHIRRVQSSDKAAATLTLNNNKFELPLHAFLDHVCMF